MSHLKIIALAGKEIAMTDLSLAILQADDYRHYRHINPEYAEFDRKRQMYWEDFYQKLLRLQAESENKKSPGTVHCPLEVLGAVPGRLGTLKKKDSDYGKN